MDGELTITQATAYLQGKGMKVSRRTVASWVEQGLFKTRRWVETPTGGYWAVSVSEIETFEKPAVGRPPKAKAESSKTVKKRVK